MKDTNEAGLVEYVAQSIIESDLSDEDAREINRTIGWHRDDTGEGIFWLSDQDMESAIQMARRAKGE